MKDKNALKLIEVMKRDFNENGFEAEHIIENLKQLREYSKEENDPMLTKVLRLTYEYIEINGTFNIAFLEDATSADISNFEYFLDLVAHSENQYNREELQELGDFLKESV